MASSKPQSPETDVNEQLTILNEIVEQEEAKLRKQKNGMT